MKSLIKTLPIPAGIRDLFDDPPLLASENAQTYWNLVSAIADDVKPCGPIEWLRVKDIVSFTLNIERLRRVKHEVIEIARRARADKIATEVYQKRTPAEMTPAECAQAAEEYRKSSEESCAKIEKERAEFEALSPEVSEAWINFIEADTRARRPEIETIQPWWTAKRASEAYHKMLRAPDRPIEERIDPETKRQLTPKLDTEADSAQAFVDSIDIHEKLERMIISLERRRDSALREIELLREIRVRRPREESPKLIRNKGFPPLAAAE